MSFLDGLKDFGKGALTVASGGATDPQYSVDPNTGQTVTTQQPRSTGDMFKSMFAGMLSGLAGGVNAHANGGPGGGLAAFANGAQANNQRLRQVDQQKRQQAQTQFDDQQTALTTKARMAQMTQESAIKAFGLARDKVQLQDADVEHFNQLQKTIQDTPGASHVGTYKDFSSFVKSQTPEQQADLIQKQSNGEIALHNVIAYDDGVPRVVGVDVYHIPTSALDKPIDKPMQIGLEHNVDPKTGIDKPTPVIAPAGSIKYREAIALNQKNLAGEVSQKDLFQQAGKERVEDIKATAAANRQQSHDDAMMARVEAANKAKEPISGEARQKLIDTFGNFKGDIGILRNYIAKTNDPAIESDIAEKYHGWSVPQYEAAKTTMKSFAGGKDHQNMTALGTGVQHAASLAELAQHLPDTSDITVLNRATAALAKQMGEPNISSYDALQTALSEELAKGYKGAAGDVGLQEKIHANLANTKGPKALAAAISTHAHAQWQRAQELAGEYRSSVPNATSNPYGPNFSKGAEAAFHSFGLDNPFNFGAGPKPENGGDASITKAPKYVMDQFMKIAGGDTAKAWQLAQSRGWHQ